MPQPVPGRGRGRDAARRGRGRRGRRRRRPGAGCGCPARRRPRARRPRWPRRRRRQQPGRWRQAICAAASAATRAAWSHQALRSGGGQRVRRGGGPGGSTAGAALGQVRSAASFPPPYQTGPPFLARVTGQGDGVPGDLAGVLVAVPLRTSTPAWSRRAKNSCPLAEAAAAVATWRRNVTRGASSRPRRAAFSFSPRVGRAGRGAVGRGGGPQPVPLLGGQAGVPDPVPLVHDRAGCRSWRASIATMCMWSSAVADRRPSGPPRLPRRTGTGRCGASRHARSRPLIVAEHPVVRRGAHRAVPHRPGVPPLAQRGVRLVAAARSACGSPGVPSARSGGSSSAG